MLFTKTTKLGLKAIIARNATKLDEIDIRKKNTRKTSKIITTY
jgi:hypothetical protein